MKILLVLAMIFALDHLSFAQQQVPVFKTPEDSSTYASNYNTMMQLFKLPADKRTPATNQMIDSLSKIQMELRQTRLVGWRYIYTPDEKFTPLEALTDGTIDPALVKHLSVANTTISELPDIVYECLNLEAMEFVNTHFDKLPGKLNRLKKLTEVRFYNNQSSKNLKLKRNKHVGFLTIRGDKPDKLPKSYRPLKKLDSLDLARNMLETFPPISKRLKRLSLSENNIALEHLKLKRNNKLEVLSLRHNRIVIVPSEIRRLRNLKKLNLQFNRIEDIGEGIAGLQKLELLSLYQNKLRFVPAVIYQLHALKEIDLYFNEIVKLEPEVSQLTNLQVLYLANNKLTTLPETLGDLKNLRELYVHHNRLSYLPENISKLSGLKVLRFNNNQFVSFPSSILRLPNLETLDLSYNSFSNLPEGITNYSHMKILVLASNPWEDKNKIIDIAVKYRARGTIVNINTLTEVVEDN